jgi:predicted enzyme related to lactoylglutathione lyase
MIRKLSVVTIWVKDQDAAKDFYTNKLGFAVRTDDAKTIPGYRWLTVAPVEQKELEIVLGTAMDEHQQSLIGKQGTWVLDTDDCQADYERLKARGVKFHGEPTDQPYGKEVVFEDLYGNTFDLLQAPHR